MTLNDFKEKLKNTFSISFLNGINILKSLGLKSETNVFNSFLTQQSRFTIVTTDFNLGKISLQDYNLEITKILSGIVYFIDSINESDLVPTALEDDTSEDKIEEEKNADDFDFEYEERYFDKYFSDEELNTETIRLDRKLILEKIDIAKIELPKSSLILKEEKKGHEYIKKLMECEELMALGNYSKAFEICEYIKNNLEPKSAQLQEYLFINYFKFKGSEDSILFDIEGNRKETLKNLELFAKRCKKYNNEEKTSETCNHNIALICYRISRAIKLRYLEINYSYINYGDNKDLRTKIEAYIDSGIDLVTEININDSNISIFLEFALTELNGGGRLDWIKVNSNWQVTDKYQYRAIEKRKQIQSILFKNNKIEATKNRLYRNLGIKYSSIKTIATNKNSRSNILSVISFIQSSIIAYKFYNDTRFLELSLEELTGNGKVQWYDLDENNRVVPIKECVELHYNPLTDLQKILFKFKKEDTYNEIIANAKDYLIRKKRLEELDRKEVLIDEEYERVKKIPTLDNSILHRKKVIECIDNWKALYELNNKEILLDKCINELSGDRIFIWFDFISFDINHLDIVNHRECIHLDFDSKQIIDALRDKSSKYGKEEDKLALTNKIRTNIAIKYAQNADYIYASI